MDFVEGLHVENGHLSPYLIRDRMRMETVLDNPYVLMTTQPISTVQELMGAIGQIMRRPEPLIILAEKVDGAALGMLVQNNQHGTMEATAIRAPGFGHRRIAYLEDLAAFAGGRVITPEAGLSLEQVDLEVLGRARRVIVTEDSTTFIEGAGSAEERRGPHARDHRRARARDQRERHRRAARAPRPAVVQARGDPRRRRDRRRDQGEAAPHRGLAGGVARRDGRGHRPRRRDRAAARRRARWTASSSTATAPRASRSCARCSPTRCSGSRPTPATTARQVVDQVRAMPDGHGLNALTGEFGDLIADGVIDPVRVTRLSLQHAASVAALLLTTEALVAEQIIGQPGAILAPGFGDLAEGMARPSSPV